MVWITVIITFLYVIYVLVDVICLMAHAILLVLLDTITMLYKEYVANVFILVYNVMLM